MSELSKIGDEVKETIYSRNKWHMLCSHFGESADKSCAATFIDRIENLTAERDEAIAAKEQMAEIVAGLKVENERLKEKESRVVFDRLDAMHPFTRACHLLQDGHISVGKALEWMRGYVETGTLGPIADGEGESIWDANERLEAENATLRARLEAMEKPVSEPCGRCGGTGEICESSTRYSTCGDCLGTGSIAARAQKGGA